MKKINKIIFVVIFLAFIFFPQILYTLKVNESWLGF